MQSYPRAFVILGADQKDCRLPEKIDFYVFYGKIKRNFINFRPVFLFYLV